MLSCDESYSRDIAARSCQTGHVAPTQHVPDGRNNDRNGAGCITSSINGLSRIHDKHIHLCLNEFYGLRGQPPWVPLGEAHIIGDAFPLKPAKFLKGYCERIKEALRYRVAPPERIRTPILCNPVAFCARAAEGHPMTPPTSAMNSRRLMQPPPLLPRRCRETNSSQRTPHGIVASRSGDTGDDRCGSALWQT